MHSEGQSTDLLRDLGKLRLDHLWDTGRWSLDDGQEAPQNSSDLKLELELAHEAQPVRKHRECLLLLLDYAESR